MKHDPRNVVVTVDVQSAQLMAVQTILRQDWLSCKIVLTMVQDDLKWIRVLRQHGTSAVDPYVLCDSSKVPKHLSAMCTLASYGLQSSSLKEGVALVNVYSVRPDFTCNTCNKITVSTRNFREKALSVHQTRDSTCMGCTYSQVTVEVQSTVHK